MLRFGIPVLVFVAATPAISSADILKQVVPFDYDANFGVTFPVVEGFDTLGGTRQLTNVTFEFHHNFALDLYFESTGPTALNEGDFALDFAYITLFQLGLAGEKGGPPGFGPGALFVGGITGALDAYDGVPGNDGPDSFHASFSDAFTATQSYGVEDPNVLAAVTDVGPLTTVFGGFNELFFVWINDPGWPIPPGGFPEYPNDAAVWVSTPTFRHFGDIAITYEFQDVPEPSSLALLGALAMFARRRR